MICDGHAYDGLKFGNSVIFRNSIIQKLFRNSEIQKFGNSAIRNLGMILKFRN